MLVEVAKADPTLNLGGTFDLPPFKSFTVYPPDGCVPPGGKGECSGIQVLLLQARAVNGSFFVNLADGITERVLKVNKSCGATFKVGKKGLTLGWRSNGGCKASWELAKKIAGSTPLALSANAAALLLSWGAPLVLLHVCDMIAQTTPSRESSRTLDVLDAFGGRGEVSTAAGLGAKYVSFVCACR
eukprot:s131_g22.t1